MRTRQRTAWPAQRAARPHPRRQRRWRRGGRGHVHRSLDVSDPHRVDGHHHRPGVHLARRPVRPHGAAARAAARRSPRRRCRRSISSSSATTTTTTCSRRRCACSRIARRMSRRWASAVGLPPKAETTAIRRDARRKSAGAPSSEPVASAFRRNILELDWWQSDDRRRREDHLRAGAALLGADAVGSRPDALVRLRRPRGRRDDLFRGRLGLLAALQRRSGRASRRSTSR